MNSLLSGITGLGALGLTMAGFVVEPAPRGGPVGSPAATAAGMIRKLPVGATTEVRAGVTYHRHGNVWYLPTGTGYRQVGAPPSDLR